MFEKRHSSKRCLVLQQVLPHRKRVLPFRQPRFFDAATKSSTLRHHTSTNGDDDIDIDTATPSRYAPYSTASYASANTTGARNDYEHAPQCSRTVLGPALLTAALSRWSPQRATSRSSRRRPRSSTGIRAIASNASSPHGGNRRAL